MAYAGLNHLALVTNDMEKTVRFYRDVLQMPVVATIGVPGMRHYFFSIGPGSTVAFFEWPGVELPPRKDAGVRATGRQFDHVSISVDSEESLLELQARLRRQGVPASDVVDHGFIHSIYFEDPNGISLEFSVWTRKLDERPELRDPTPVADTVGQQA